ncbi:MULTISPECIES: tetratricopeptide repeat protein [Azospira]|jgi:tetratricopeptide (TPR) repeat protein|uniref:Flp pilus assembly protein TadD n=1 Tax=Azospira oryzae (strain ATCC BAA-33 / DSM 13638 / PS) TaxID=640081 RepID=G8QJL0_AZOOP|nr:MULTISPECIES: tetratricopeptide repeat protein [Azospira]AEV25435.1 Flp pilus assembly protein TadD [Azospira oryzae PS]MDK9690970.1 tetratricopeptide repeat protein [Azospira sp.]TLS17359.1 MAG: tetratricopeptide repeat protein [Betaproteobacteria bacterium]
MKMIPLAVLVAALAANGALAADAAPAPVAKSRAAKAERAPRAPAAVPTSAAELPAGQVAYQVLLAEIALRRGYGDLALSVYAELALRSRDPQVLARAIEVAGFARRMDLAHELAQLWVETEPESVTARQTLVGVLIVLNRLDDLVPHLSKLLEQDKDNLGDNLSRLNRMLVRQPDKSAVLRLVQRVTQPYQGVAEAHFAVAQAALAAGDRPLAQESVRRAQELRPEWEMPVLLEAQIVSAEAPAKVVPLLERYLSRHPNAKDVRLHLARAYVGDKRFSDASAEFRRLLRDFPNSVEVVYPVAILALQQNDLDTAETQLKHLLELEFGDRNLVNYYLGQVMEARKNEAAAIDYYGQVGLSEPFLNARNRQAMLLARAGKLDEARQVLQQTATMHPTERVALGQSEAQLLRDAKRYAEALEVLERLLKSNPGNAELLYDSALVADRLDKVALVEERLRQVIALQPENAHAYNALGYTFAERNMRLDEARELVARALALLPDDAFIIDSMGWVLYRQGDLAGALIQLQKAYGLRQDPEIAAHMGEVLWGLGRQDEARRVLREAARKDPDNEALAAAVKKFQP